MSLQSGVLLISLIFIVTALSDTNDKNELFASSLELKIDQKEENNLILPTTSVPERYRLHLDTRKLYEGSNEFSGEVEIDALVKRDTDKLVIHSKNLQIHDLKVFNSTDFSEIPIIEYSLYLLEDTLTIDLPSNLTVDSKVTIRISFSTTMFTYESGFYQKSYTNNGTTRYLGATQFQATEARLAFPCYDEPALKSVFELKITHDERHHAIANTFGIETSNGDGTATTHFEPSPIMSSYLLAFVVSDLKHISNIDDKLPDETLHRVWVRPDSLSGAPYALENSIKVLKALEEHVGFNYELPKVDSAGIPGKAGAIENWGMITYRENAMIYEENVEEISHALKLSGVVVISHELAHQFLGDSVTCDWWDYIWLNEGFATLFEYYLTGLIHPEWRTRDFFNIRTLQSAFRSDSREATRAMTPTPSLLTTSEILSAFDYVVYAKAGSVLRMFQYAVGENVFRDSLNLYLIENDHKAVNSQHLIDAFQTLMDQQNMRDFNFETVFRTWELQKGYPMIHVSLTSSGQFNITQQRFYTLKSEITDTTSSWYIPLTFATESNPNFEDTRPTNFFVNTDSTALISPPVGFDASQWFVFNKQQLGYYRVNYDFANWHALILALNSDDYDKIHVLNRVQLIDDSLTFAAGGYLDYNAAFGILSYLTRETEYTAWFVADRFISQLYTAFGPLNDDLNEFVHHLTEKFYDTFKVPEDEMIPFEEVYERYSRELAFKLACNSGNDQCLYDTFIQNHHLAHQGRSVPKGLENVIFCSGFRGENKQAEWIALWHLMLNTSDATYKTQLINGLGCSDDPVVQKDFLESILGIGITVSYTQQERRSVFSSVLNSHSGLDAVISFMKDFEIEIMRALGFSLEEILTNIARTIKNQTQQNVFLSYLEILNHLDLTTRTKLENIVGDNLQLQARSPNNEILEIIQNINGNRGSTQNPSTSTSPIPSTENPPSTQQLTSESTTADATVLVTNFFTVFIGLLTHFTGNMI